MTPSTMFDPSDVPEGGLLRVVGPDEAAAVGRVDGVLYAVIDVCTHQYCELSGGDIEGSAIYCPCHGSKFDIRDGSVLSGPALQPLQVLTITELDRSRSIEWGEPA